MRESLITQEMIDTFEAGGGQVKRLRTMSPVTGQIRGYMAEKRAKYLEEGYTIDDLPDWCMTYEERKARRLLPHQKRADERAKKLQRR